ncbi:hypothetical protein ACYSNM_10835 [Myroides sp. LJL116]
MERNTMIEQMLTQVKQKEDQWYSHKVIYALPEWFSLVCDAKEVALLAVHGKEGLKVIRQRIDFKVDFYNEESILYYFNFLDNQMDKSLPVVGYVLFYNENIIAQKDKNYKKELTSFELEEIRKYNLERDKVKISTNYFDTNFNMIDTFE